MSKEKFHADAEALLENESVTTGTMMGYPCLRIDGDFFASFEPKTGHLIIKLPADRVLELMEQGAGLAFAPNGRRFKEWIAIPDPDTKARQSWMSEALAFVGNPK